MGAGPNVFSMRNALGLDCHNAYLSVWLEGGLASLFAFLGLLVIPLLCILKGLPRGGSLDLKTNNVHRMSALVLTVGIAWLVSISVFAGEKSHEIWVFIAISVTLCRVVLMRITEGRHSGISVTGDIKQKTFSMNRESVRNLPATVPSIY